MYDFIIFEHTGLRNHMVDLCNIGQLLIDSGLKVAIANVTNERELCSDCGFKILDLSIKRESYKTSRSYMKAVIKELSPKTKNFYVGSIPFCYLVDMVEIRSTTSQGFPLGVEKFLFHPIPTISPVKNISVRCHTFNL